MWFRQENAGHKAILKGQIMMPILFFMSVEKIEEQHSNLTALYTPILELKLQIPLKLRIDYVDTIYWGFQDGKEKFL
jgi:hypothetical protein